MQNRSERLSELLRLSHEIGDPRRPLAILAEGNTSVRIDNDTFLVKASGCNLGQLKDKDLVQCRRSALVSLFDMENLSDAAVEAALLAARVDTSARKPSVESLFHAWLLGLPEIEFVGHAHSPCVNAVLCSPRGKEFASKRLFPDEIVCCDVTSVYVPYTDPGLQLARRIKEETEAFIQTNGRPPRVILLENHGIIGLGRTADAVLAALWMAEKAAEIWLGAAVLGGPVFLSAENVTRISGRTDEKQRRQILNL